MADLGSRGLLPDGTNSYTFANSIPQPEPREKHKNYVFVDEHNRHRRLKVMRACAACRRRKIRCDAATTNTWPCGPCVKQQLECIPPSSDKDSQDDTQDDQRQTSFHAYHPSNANSNQEPSMNYSHPSSVHPGYPYTTSSSLPSSASTFFDGSGPSSSLAAHSVNHDHLTPLTPQFPQQGYPASVYNHSPSAVSTSGVSQDSDTSTGQLASVLQELKIDQGGVAPYIANQQIGEAPALEEQEAILPPPQRSPDSTVRIPAEMMPSEQVANKYFDYFFTNIHPYVPVISRSAFLQAWQMDRYTLPPLILEGIFACASHLMGYNDERSRWLALAARHEESFKDMPRLSTIQGLVLVMKARESAPKRGYYYRSWMTIQFMIQMGKDLGLHTHGKAHVQGTPCNCEPHECLLKSRVWHTLFQMEVMIGGPQGRYDFAVDADSANSEVPRNLPGVDYTELKISQDQAFYVKLVHNVRITAALYTDVKAANGDCSKNVEFRKHNERYKQLSKEFPPHLRIKYPEDGSPPSIPFHYVANMQAYHRLAFIMHLRPQLEINSKDDDEYWKDIMIMCHDEAIKICRLHESIIQSFGLSGLLCMMRGINTAIYTILSCTLLHLVAITHPDPVLHGNAKDYFARHMRILEQCSDAWPVQQLQVQIDSLRQAFSADLSKPFELKQNFPCGSPQSGSGGLSPPADAILLGQQQRGQATSLPQFAGSYTSHPITSPHTSLADSQDMMPPSAFNSADANHIPNQQPQWDPSGVFDKWHTAFSPSQLESPSPSIHSSQMHPQTLVPTSAAHYNTHPQHPQSYFSVQQNQGMSSASSATISSAYQGQMPQQQHSYLTQGHTMSPPSYVPVAQPYVTPSMWQDVVAQSSGWKRRHDGDGADMNYKRMR